jgi:hypothetical protein
MTQLRYIVQSKGHATGVVFNDTADHAAFSYDGHSGSSPASGLGRALWEAMSAAGVAPGSVNHFLLFEDAEDGKLVGSLYPVLRGAQAVWLPMYRADKDSTCFRSLPASHRVGDALDDLFGALANDIKQPFKG